MIGAVQELLLPWREYARAQWGRLEEVPFMLSWEWSARSSWYSFSYKKDSKEAASTAQWKKKGYLSHVRLLCFLFFIHLFSLLLPSLWPLPISLTPLASRQNLICPLLQFCWRVNISNNKKNKAFLLVEIRIAIQRDSYHCFHAQVYYNPNWFISIRPLHYFPVTFP
jgi:hypothetical protein